MASVNKVIIVGNLGKDPVCRNGNNGSGQLFANFSVATTEHWTDQASQEVRERTEWHSIVLRGRLAEIARDYLHKGSQVYLEGTLRTRKWADQENGVERFITEIHCDSMQMLGSPNQSSGGGSSSAKPCTATCSGSSSCAFSSKQWLYPAVAIFISSFSSCSSTSSRPWTGIASWRIYQSCQFPTHSRTRRWGRKN